MRENRTILSRVFLGFVFYTIVYLFIPAVYDLNSYDQCPLCQSHKVSSVSCGHNATFAQLLIHHLKRHKRQLTHKNHHQVIKKDPAIRSFSQICNGNSVLLPIAYRNSYAISGCYTDIITPPPSVC